MADDLQPFQEEIAQPYSEDTLRTLFAAMDETELVNGKKYSGKGFGEKIRYQSWPFENISKTFFT